MSSNHQKSPSPPMTDSSNGGANKSTHATGAASSAGLSLDEIDERLLRYKQRPPLSAADASSSSSSSSSSQRRVTTSGAGAVRVSIGTFQSQVVEQRPEPTKLDFLPTAALKNRSGRHSVGAMPRLTAEGQVVQVKNLLQTELNETLSRARLRQMQSSITPPPPPPPPVVGKPVTSSNEGAVTSQQLSVADKKKSVILELKSRNPEVDTVENNVEKTVMTTTSMISETHASTFVIAGSGPLNQVVAKDVQHNASKPLVTSPVKQVDQQQQEQGTIGRRQHQRLPSKDIQAKMASLAAAAAACSTTTLPAAPTNSIGNGGISLRNAISSSSNSLPSSSSSYRNDGENISQSADNKVTIIVNAYVPPTSSEMADAKANNQTQSTSSHHSTLGQT
jgi:hypothetical protein